MRSDASFAGALTSELIRATQPHRARSLRIPGTGRRLILTDDPGEATLLANEVFATNLGAVHRDGDGQLIDQYDLGSGLVTNMGVLALANDFAWSSSLNLSTLGTQNFHATGTGATAAAATDFQMQTLAAPTTSRLSRAPSRWLPR
jgi:hypothetical protein